jgi:hypothetical protein
MSEKADACRASAFLRAVSHKILALRGIFMYNDKDLT